MCCAVALLLCYCAVLCRAVPCCAVLCRAVPCCAVLCRAVLCQPGEDPFTIMRQEKRERIRTQQKQQLANVKQAMQAGGAAAVPATLRLAAALPTKGKGAPTKRKELRDEVGRGSWWGGGGGDNFLEGMGVGCGGDRLG
jgi:hypothetical protein